MSLRHSSPITWPISASDFHETSPNSMWAFYTSYQLTLTNIFLCTSAVILLKLDPLKNLFFLFFSIKFLVDRRKSEKNVFKLVTKWILKKTYGDKYYVAASISFEEKSYTFIRKMKWYTRASNPGVWGGVGPPKIGYL